MRAVSRQLEAAFLRGNRESARTAAASVTGNLERSHVLRTADVNHPQNTRLFHAIACANSVNRGRVRSCNLPENRHGFGECLKRKFHATASTHAAKRDPYDTLGVSRSASKDEVKKAYYKLVKQYHPDVNKDDKNAAAKFQEVQGAYEILSDDSKRGAFDAHGHAGVDAEENGGGRGPGGPGFGAGGFPNGIDPEELFAAMFGGMMGEGGSMGGMRGGPRRGQDVQTSITIPFMEAVNGCSKTITAPALSNCGGCNGKGSADGAEATSCKTCRGTGQQSMQQGVYTIMTTCRACGGAGSSIKNPCRKCNGAGVQRTAKSVTVNIPPGVDTGINLRMAGEGDVGSRGAPAGHLFVRINVEPDPFFERDDSDIHVKVPLSVVQAALGCKISVPTVKGEAEVTVPPGTQPGDTIVLRAKGVKRLGSSSSGNQVVHLQLQVPKSLTPRMRTLLSELDAELKGTGATGSSSATGTESAGYAKLFSDTLGRIKKAMNPKA